MFEIKSALGYYIRGSLFFNCHMGQVCSYEVHRQLFSHLFLTTRVETCLTCYVLCISNIVKTLYKSQISFFVKFNKI